MVLFQNFLHEKDVKNQLYLRKRALYLTYLAKELSQWDAVSDIKYKYHRCNHMKPVLEYKLTGSSLLFV